ncbi:MAG: N-acetylmuramic acid 6-phosphate etherase [Chitinophagales bacterium]|nr:N-acetylmuramic acid 6-phosphate etherase [Chitinophagales bacterium]MDW8419675.1 N-acetylmuramic acid 6-phosphate etherase [Chitinophagales bacterium]
MNFTEQASPHRHLEKMSTRELLERINGEDSTVPAAVARAIPQIEKLADAITDKMLAGGRLFYVGAGTSGRLGIVDASECPPTYGVPHGLVVGIIAGGDSAIRRAVEHAEDDRSQGWKDLQQHHINTRDVVVGITASGRTPYVAGALQMCRTNGILTGCITCNLQTEVAQHSDFPVEVITGPEFVTGSTRMKAGTAQKLVLNMLSTTVMIKLGRVEDNKMVHMQLTNDKLIDRGVRMVMEATGLDYDTARTHLLTHGSVKKAIEVLKGED